jgi:hypothetical protein
MDSFDNDERPLHEQRLRNLETAHYGEARPVDAFAAAVAFAAEAHTGQVYKGYNGRADEPYILHALRVAMAVTPEERIVAVLHDVQEDAGRLPAWLNEAERAALDALTRRPPFEYETYIATVAMAGPLAVTVKVADLRDHLQHNPPTRLEKRYRKALAVLAPSL